jgi:hypothetical protein
MSKAPIFIAEVKTQSMFGFQSKHSRFKLFDTALEYGDWVSIHTDARFGGSFDDIYMARRETNKPILAKGFHCSDDDVKKAYDMGANYVLVVDRYSHFNESYPRNTEPIFEISKLEDIDHLIDPSNYKVVFNGRNLETGIGKKSLHQWKEYREKCSWDTHLQLVEDKFICPPFYIADRVKNGNFIYRKIQYYANWEDGSRFFKSKGYKNYLTLPSTIIPQHFSKYLELIQYINASVWFFFGEAITINQPKNWTGEVQIPPERRENIWIEEYLQLVEFYI